jgi:hypothetical protein
LVNFFLLFCDICDVRELLKYKLPKKYKKVVEAFFDQAGNVVDPKLFYPDPGPTLTLILDPACL